MPPWKKTTI